MNYQGETIRLIEVGQLIDRGGGSGTERPQVVVKLSRVDAEARQWEVMIKVL